MAVKTSYLVSGTPGTDEYSTVAAWKSARQAVRTDLTGGNGEVLVVQKTGNHSSENISISGWTTDVDNYPKITVADGYRHDGTPQSGFYISRDSGADNTPVFDIADDFALIEYFDVENTRSSGTSSDAFHGDAASFHLHACIGKATAGLGFDIYNSGSPQSANWPLASASLVWGGFGRTYSRHPSTWRMKPSTALSGASSAR